MAKKLSKILWYGAEKDALGKPVIPPLSPSVEKHLEGLNEGEIYIHNDDEYPALYIRTNKDKIVAKDIICKCIENPDFKAIELPIKSNNKNLVIDFICIKDKPVSYDNMHDWIKQINYANYIKINTLNLPLIDMIHNYSSDSYFESNIVDFLFDPLRLKNNLDNELFINQINQINKLTLSYEKELLRNSAKTSKEEYTINDEYMFIIRDVENNSIIFIGNFN